MLVEELDSCCLGLDSNKVTQRRKCAEILKELLTKPEVIKLLNCNERRRNWDYVYMSFHRFIKREAEKLHQTENKQTANSSQIFRLRIVSDTFLFIVTKANSDDVRLSLTKIFETCMQSLDCAYIKKYFGFVYLKILVLHMLPVSSYWGKLKINNWQEMFITLKDLYKNPCDLDKELIIRGLFLTTKYGLLHNSLNFLLQNEFEFIKNISMDLTNNTNSVQQHQNILQLLMTFSEEMSKHCRMASCILGENIFRLLLDFLYHLRHECYGDRKILIFKYVLLQLRIHHPNGVTETSDASYAYNSDRWKAMIRSLHTSLCDEIDIILRYSNGRRIHNIMPQLLPLFLELFVEVTKQVLDCGTLDIAQPTVISDHMKIMQPTKKRKLLIGIPALITAIQKNDNWPWLSILAKLIEYYPKVIQPHEFLMILDALATLQAECKDIISRHYLYSVLIQMVRGEQYQDEQNLNKEKIDLLWTRIWETSLRSAGLNQNEETTHKLIQVMLELKKNVQSASLLSMYLSGFLNISKHSIYTMYVLFGKVNLPEYLPTQPDIHIRKYLINFVLNNEKILNNSAVYYEKTPSKILVGLVLKSWPYLSKNIRKSTNIRLFSSIEHVYFLTAFESGLLCDKPKINKLNIQNTEENNHLIHSEAFSELSNRINSFCGSLYELQITMKSEIIKLINGISFVMNLISELLKFEIINDENALNIVNIKELFQMLFAAFQKQTNKEDLVILLKHFAEFLSLKMHPIVTFSLIRSEISVDFLKMFFDFLNAEVEVPDECDDDMEDNPPLNANKLTVSNNYECNLLNENLLNVTQKMQMEALRILTSYSCVPNSDVMLKKQKQVLVTLIQPDFDANDCLDFQMTIHFLKSLAKCKIGSLTNESADLALKCLQNLMTARYENYYAARLLIQLLKDLIPHINYSTDEDARSKLLILLIPFYDRRESYDSELLIDIIDCFGAIFKIDAHGKWPNHEELVIKLIEFLKSNFVEVRLSSMKTILYIFSFDLNTSLTLLKEQENLMPVLKNVIQESFTVTCNLNKEQVIEEAANRTASALHIYAALIVVSPMWRNYFLCNFVELVADKKINAGLVQKVLQIVTNYLNLPNVNTFLYEHINSLVTQWCQNKRLITAFPYKIFKCDTELIFYEKYKYYVVPILLMQRHLDILEVLSQEIKQSVAEIIKNSYPTIIGQFLPNLVCSEKIIVEQNNLYSKQLFEQLYELLSEDETELLDDMLDQILLELLNRVYDSDHFSNQFQFSYFLSKSNPLCYNVEIFHLTLKYIENKISDPSMSIIEYCTKKCPHKLERVLFEMTANIYNKSSIEDKLISFHRFSILVDMISIQLHSKHDLNTFLIRSITSHLMNLINLNENQLLSISACRYFKKFTTDCLKFCSNIFQNFLFLIVSTLVPVAKLNTELSAECVEILNFLIKENSKYLHANIKALDPFPKDEKFEQIQDVYKRIKYGNHKFSLEQEIKHFLNVGRNMDVFCDRTDGLVHLKQQICDKKNELKNLYEELFDLGEFCETSQESILHQLICMLVELTASSIPEVKLEAARCLGELGPSDLATLVLKPEKPLCDLDKSPLELFVGQVTVLLSRYLVSHDVKIVRAARKALYATLNTKEGTNIVKNGDNIDYGCGILGKLYVLPFIRRTNVMPTLLKINDDFFQISIDQSDLWCPTTPKNHADWIITLVSKLLETFEEKCYLRNLIPICRVKMKFAELLLPLIIFLILTLKKPIYTQIISKQIKQFFETHWIEASRIIKRQQSVLQSSNDAINFIVFNQASVQCMLNTVHFVRLQQNVYKNSVVDKLKLNYLHIAQGAQFCAAYFTSILYAELWCYDKLNEKKKTGKEDSSCSILETVCENEEFSLKLSFQNMLRESYKNIGDVDAMYGCGTSYILNTESRIDYYKNIGNWDKVVLYHNKQFTETSFNKTNDLVSALKITGLHNLAFNAKTEDLNSKFECAWRLNDWNFSDETNNTFEVDTSLRNNFEKYHYFALKSLHEQDFANMNQSIAHSRNCIINSLTHTSLESSKSLYKSLTELKMLQDIENFAAARQNNIMEELFEFWKTENSLNKNDFEYVEPIRAQRITLIMDDFLKNESAKMYLVEMYLQMAEHARKESVYHVAQQSLDSMSTMNLTSEMRGRMLYEQAQLSWLDDKTSSRYLLKYLLDNNENMIPLELYSKALTLYGNWMVETRSENPITIIDNYFTKSLTVLQSLNHSVEITNRCETLDSLARFADAEYQQVSNYISSSSFESKLDIIKKSRDMALKIKHDKNTSDERRAIALYERQSTIDETEVNNAYNEKNMYLKLAIQNYLRILEYSDLYNFKIFRILSLSLDNKTNKDVLCILNSTLPTIASYKYIPLLPQLVPHIVGANQSVSSFEKIIQELLERCALDHPHHTLPIILAVADTYKDRNYDDCANADLIEKRVQVAKDMLVKLKKKRSLTQIIKNMELISNALISLAYVDASKCSKRGTSSVIPRSEAIMSIKNFDNVLVPTISLEIKKNKNYKNIIGIQEFSGTFSMVGGVNAPKKITCTGTDGIPRTQLVKGKDDLRQDAVMQQVFSILNSLLAKNKQTSKLFIRTYKVVPLSQRSGIIEWCENTEPLGGYLSNAHIKYHPTDWSPAECRSHLRAVHTKDPTVKYRKFKEICEHLRPVFHMFFITTYPQSTIWFERRRAYIHSVASSSMVGYILGLGDRHVHNILLDINTAEVVHIDFGIAFEQGKCLPTPETVPFRLSRDIESGLGICGIEGVFRRSCEKTMQVLRHNAETVLTILQVLLYDPLYVWTITPAEAYSRQKDDDDKSIDFSDDTTANSVNITAERALLRLKEKLQGMENGAVCSIERQVELLLQQARDPVNLSRLFNGWQPYL